MQELQERLRSDVLAVLTAEQQAKLKQLQAERPARREGGRNQQP
jgi:Spy/CpxP family protein refolding chaperone